MALGFMWDRLQVDRITVQDRLGNTESGDPEWGPSRIVCAKLEDASTIVVRPDGNERQANHRIFSSIPIPLSSRLWLPQDDKADEDKARRPLSVKAATSFSHSQTVFETML